MAAVRGGNVVQATSKTAGTSLVGTAISATSVGDVLVASVIASDMTLLASAGTFADSKGNTWTKQTESGMNATSGGFAYMAFFTCTIATGKATTTSDTFTFSHTSSTRNHFILVERWTGLNPTVRQTNFSPGNPPLGAILSGSAIYAVSLLQWALGTYVVVNDTDTDGGVAWTNVEVGTSGQAGNTNIDVVWGRKLTTATAAGIDYAPNWTSIGSAWAASIAEFAAASTGPFTYTKAGYAKENG